jgi:hypothetical protein
MNFEISGKLVEIFKEQKVSERFTKREFILEVPDNNFVQLLKFQLVQDKTDLINPYKVGETVTVSFNLKGSKWKDSYFVNLDAWRISRKGATGKQTDSYEPPMPPENDDFDMPPPPDDDMPF